MKTKMRIAAILLTTMSLMPIANNTVDAQQVRARITIGTPPPVYPDNGQYYYPQSRFYNDNNTYYKYNTVHPYYGYRHEHGEYGNMHRGWDRNDRNNYNNRNSDRDMHRDHSDYRHDRR